jgi:hypothetical protein
VRVGIAEHIVIPEPEHLIPALSEEGCPSLIGSDLSSMVAAIELDHQPVGRTAEIHNVRADGVLPAKLGVMKLPVPQLPPEYPLAVGLPPAKPSGQSTVHAPSPFPSPHKGEGTLVVHSQIMHFTFQVPSRKWQAAGGKSNSKLET